MLGLYLLNPANVLVLIGQLSQPGTSFHMFSRSRAYPGVILVMGVTAGSDNNPRQNVQPGFFPPEFDIIGMKRGVISFQEI